MKNRKLKNVIDRVVVCFLILSMIFGSTHIPTILGGNVASPSNTIRINTMATDNDADEDIVDSEEKTEGNFIYVVRGDKIVIKGLVDDFTGSSIEIPAEIEGKKVSEIADNAFYLKNLSQLTFESAMELKKIGAYAFAGNELINIDFPDSIEEIAASAFRDNELVNLNLNKVKKVGENAFINNIINSLDLGTELKEIEAGAFKNNNLKEVNIPASLEKVGEDIFADNKRFVKLINASSNANVGVEDKIPSMQTKEDAYGYVIDPVAVKISFIDKDTGRELLDTITIGDDLSSLDYVYAKGIEREYKPPVLQAYELYSENNEDINSIRFTPDRDNYELKIEYVKKSESIELKLKDRYIPLIGINESKEDVLAKLRSFIVARNSRGEDLSSKVEISPEDIDTTNEGRVYEIFYTLRDEDSGEVKYLSTHVYVGTDMKNFPIGHDWVLGDFWYGGDSGESNNIPGPNKLVGLSAQGMQKIATNKELVLPHINPTTGDRITATVNHRWDPIPDNRKFANQGLRSVEVFEDGIRSLELSFFANNPQLERADIPNIEEIKDAVFAGDTALTEFDFSKLRKVGDSAFSNTGIKTLIAPELIQGAYASFRNTPIGTDESYPNGIYLPKMEKIFGYMFENTKLKYIDKEKQFPNATVIDAVAFGNCELVESISLPGITKIGTGAFRWNKKNRNLYAPDVLEIEGAGFFGNYALKNVDLPKLVTLGSIAFMSDYNVGYASIESINLPEVQTIGDRAFRYQKIKGTITLPKVLTIGDEAFTLNNIEAANFPVIQTMGTRIFFNEGFADGNRDGIPDYNPGMKFLGYYIPVYTNENTTLINRENYIINPKEGNTGVYDEDDFTWDTADTNKVTGFTTKGKVKYIANNYELVLPDRATSIAPYAFNSEKIRKIRAENVTVVGDFAFERNNFENIELPKLKEVGRNAFALNVATEDKKIRSMDLSNLEKVGVNSFWHLGLESVNVPKLTEVVENAFANNRIKDVYAPKLKKIENGAFGGNKIAELTAASFPELEYVGSGAFYLNSIDKIDLPKLTFSYGSVEYINADIWRSKPLIWDLHGKVKPYEGNTPKEAAEAKYRFGMGGNKGPFRYLINPDKSIGAHYTDLERHAAEPKAIILTDGLNADGTVNRTNAFGHKETFEELSYVYKGQTVRTRNRTAIINPSTVLVKYRTDDGLAFDGNDGRPKLDDYREYIYEEQSRQLETGAFESGKNYKAAAIDGYVLYSSTDAENHTVLGKDNVDVSYQTEGNRTDREITFVYKKIDDTVSGGAKLQYGISDANGVNIIAQEGTYYTRWQPANVLTKFIISDVTKVIKKGKIKISIDSPYIDPKTVAIDNGSGSSVWYDSDSWFADDKGIEIKLKENIPIGSPLDAHINFAFKRGVSPDGASINLKMTLLDENNGRYEKIAESKLVNVKQYYAIRPRLLVHYPNNLVGYPYNQNGDFVSGPRDLGRLRDIANTKAVVENPDIREYYYTIEDLYFNVNSISLVTVLPKYTAVRDDGTEEERTAQFDASINPDWKLSSDGKSVQFGKTLVLSTRNTGNIENVIPSLKLKFPGAKENVDIENKSFAYFGQAKDFRDINDYPTVAARGRLGIGDILTVRPLYITPEHIYFDDIKAEKRGGERPRRVWENWELKTYLYDNNEDRKKEIAYELNVAATNEATDYKNVSIIDYDLDSRLYYSGLAFLNTPLEAGNMDVDILAYKKIGTYINPAADTLVFEKRAKIDSANNISFAKADIDYIQIKIPDTQEIPLSKDLRFLILAKVKDTNRNLLSAGMDNDVLRNEALFLGNRYAKGTDINAGARPDGEMYNNLSENTIIERSAKVDVLAYKMLITAMKELAYEEEPDKYPIYPEADSTGAVVEGQKGAYHIYLKSNIVGKVYDKGEGILENLQITDIVPEAIEINKSDIELDPRFIRNGGKFEFIEGATVTEDGNTVKRNLIKFSANNFDTRLYTDKKMHIASIRTKYSAATTKTVLNNRIYAKWSNTDVEYAKPIVFNLNGTEEKFAYDDAKVNVVGSSSLLSSLYIRNDSDRVWQKEVDTKSEETFDYKMLISNYSNSQNGGYKGIDIVNVLPVMGDISLNKQGLRGTEFDGAKLDISRLSQVFKVPTGYEVKYYNGNKKINELLDNGRTMDSIVDDTSLVAWDDTPSEDTKMIRIKAKAGTVLNKTESLELVIPMKAPSINNLNDAKLDKKAVNSFVIRHFSGDSTAYTNFVEMNTVSNIMKAPFGSITLTKFAKEGRLQTAPEHHIGGAKFGIYYNNRPNEPFAVAVSDANGEVRFDKLLTNRDYIVKELEAPEGYILSNGQKNIGVNEFKVATNYNYRIDDATSKSTFMNYKEIKGSLTIKKTAADTNVPLSNVEFKIKGLDVTNNTFETRVTTDVNGNASLDNLVEGRYSIEEIESANPNRYQKAENLTVRIDADNTDIIQNIVNDKFQVLLKKIAVNDENLLNPENWDSLTDFQKKKLSGYKFKVVGEDGMSFTTDYTNTDGSVILKNLKTGIVYTVTEAPLSEQINSDKDLYSINTNEYKFKITHDGKLVNAAEGQNNGNRFKQYALNIPNKIKEIRGKILVKKVDKNDETKTLAGAKLAIYKVNLNTNGNNVSDEINSIEQVGDIQTTNNEGIATFEGLESGIYQVKEIEPPAGYILNKTAIDINIPKEVPANVNADYDKTGTHIIYTQTKKLLNSPVRVVGIKGSDIAGHKNMPLSAAKLYIESKKNTNPNLKYRIIGESFATVYEPVNGAKFELYKLENGVKTGNPIAVDSTNQSNTTIVSDANGNISFGDYKFEFNTEYGIFETSAADGYEINEGYKTFKLSDAANKAGFNGTYTFYINNETSKGEISISKYDSVAKKNLAGIRFKLYKGNKNSVDFNKVYRSVVTKDDGIAYFPRLAFGDYVLKEDTVPVGYKQITDDDILEFKLRETKGATDDGPIVKKKIFNTKLINISVTKKWEKGSEKSVKIKLLRATSKKALDGVSAQVVKVDNLTDNNGIVQLDSSNNWTVKYENLDMADSNGNIYYFKPVELEVRNGELVDDSYTGSLDKKYDYTVLTGSPEFGFVLTNTAKNTTAIGVTKEWEFGKTDEAKKEEILNRAKVEVALKRVKTGGVIPADGDVVEDLKDKVFKQEFVDASTEDEKAFKHELLDGAQDTTTGKNPWQYVYKNLPIREWGEDIVYRVEEVGNIDGFKAISSESYSYDEENKTITITNKAINRNINVEKIWEGVDGVKAPRVSVAIFDSEDMTKAIDTKELSLENGKYTAHFDEMPSYAYTVSDTGNISARAIKYVLKETYYDAKHPQGYEAPEGYKTDVKFNIGNNTELESDDAFNIYTQADNADRDIDIKLSNSLEKTTVKITKTWVGIKPELAPEVKVKLIDYTADNSRNHDDETKHIDVKTDIVLNSANNFTVVLSNLPKYKPDGLTAIKYGVIELNNFAGYKLSAGNGSEILGDKLISNVALNTTTEGTAEGVNVNTAQEINFNLINTRKAVDINLSKTWDVVSKLYEEQSEDKPDIKLHLWAVLDDNLQAKTEVTKNIFDESLGEIVLTKDTKDIGNKEFTKVLRNLPKYTADGAKLIKYYVTEEEITGFKNPENPILLGEVSGEAEGGNSVIGAVLKNVQERFNINVDLYWRGLEAYEEAERENTPTVHIDLYVKSTDGSRKLVTARAESVLTRDTLEHNLYKISFSDLPKYDLEGNKLEYEIEEREASPKSLDYIAGYSVEVSKPETVDVSDKKYTITNTAKSLDIVVNKEWLGGKKEDSIEVKLLRKLKTQGDIPDNGTETNENGNVITTVMDKNNTYIDNSELRDALYTQNIRENTAGVYTYKFEKMPMYAIDGKSRYEYSLKEKLIAGYETKIIKEEAGTNIDDIKKITFDIKNMWQTVDINVSKNWEGIIPSKAPNVRVQLVEENADGTQSFIENEIKVLKYDVDESKSFKAEFENLPKFKNDGKTQIKYNVIELNEFKGYDFKSESIFNSESSDKSPYGSFIVKVANKRKIIEDATIEKTWDNKDDTYTRPSVHFSLYTKLGDEYKLVSLIKENGIYKPELLAAGGGISRLNIDANSGWKLNIKDLPKYDDSGENLLEYYIKEEPILGYEVPDEYIKLEYMENGNLYAKLENKIEKRTIVATKKWDGIENYSKEELKNLAKVHGVLFDVTDESKKTEVDRLEFVKGDDGEYRAIFKDIPKYKSDGKTPIAYTVEELESGTLEGFTTMVEKKAEDAYLITNTLKTDSISVTKTWRTPPFLVDKVEVYLTKDGIKIGEPVTLSADTGWTYSFKNLPEYEPDGKTKIKYSVKEVEVFAYQSHVKDVNGDGKNFEIYNIYTGIVKDRDGVGGSAVNRFVESKIDMDHKIDKEHKVDAPETNPNTIEKVKGKILSLIPKTGDANNIMLYAVSLIGGLLCIIFILMSRKKDKK